MKREDSLKIIKLELLVCYLQAFKTGKGYDLIEYVENNDMFSKMENLPIIMSIAYNFLESITVDEFTYFCHYLSSLDNDGEVTLLEQEINKHPELLEYSWATRYGLIETVSDMEAFNKILMLFDCKLKDSEKVKINNKLITMRTSNTATSRKLEESIALASADLKIDYVHVYSYYNCICLYYTANVNNKRSDSYNIFIEKTLNYWRQNNA